MKFRTLLLGLTALFVALNAAFFSVSGLSKLFAGASLSVIVMASSLELAKLITAGYLYNYWDKINKGFRVYLSIGVVVLVMITSLGIYGFLTSAFQETFNQFNVKEKQLAFLQQKESFWGSDVARYDSELNRISENISTLSNAKSSSIQVRDTSTTSGFRNTISTSELRISQKRIKVEELNRKGVQLKREIAADSLQTIQLKILDVESSEGVSSELGPLEYLSGLLDKPMDVIINWFILIIIFVFDPLAVALVIAFNNAVKVDKGEKDRKKASQSRELYGEKENDSDVEDVVEDIADEDVDSFHTEWENNQAKTDEDDITKDDDSEWDSDHALDMVMNEMVSDTSVKLDTIIESNDITDEANEELVEAVVTSSVVKEFTPPISEESKKLSNLRRDTSRRGIDIDGDGTIDGYDNNGDGLIDEPMPSSSKRARYVINEKPFYARPNFNWGDTKSWINNQNAVNYWLTHIKNQKASNYPTDFSSKIY